jgi:extracellular elastinolytic metalloproteinase
MIFRIGQWVTNNEIGLRMYLYSTDLETNPHMYSELNTDIEPHDIGEVWSSILYEVYCQLYNLSFAIALYLISIYYVYREYG